MLKKGFDNELYLKMQSEFIQNRITEAGGRLYLEFGGKLFDDCHAARILPGFDLNAKVKLLQNFKEQAELIIAINAKDIERNKIRADHGINYGSDVLRLIDLLRGLSIYINSVVITQYEGQPTADVFRKKLERRGENVFVHTRTKGYPTDIDTIISDEGYGQNPYIPTTRPLVVVTAPGPGSGKLATCLCQMYHEYKRGNKVGYAKFETFPVWNLPLKHPVNMAYEAATADLKDVNMIDHFHLEAYGKMAVNYNRDIEVFPVIRTILKKITGKDTYLSPTDMGVNMVGNCITDNAVVEEACKQEIIRRYLKALCDYKQGIIEKFTIDKIELLMTDLGISPKDRKVVCFAKTATRTPAIALELPDGKLIMGKSSSRMSCTSAMLLNAVKELANIDDKIDLLSPVIIDPILQMKETCLHDNKHALTLEETLIALSICAATSPIAKYAISQISLLQKCEAHSTCILPKHEETILKKLGINLTSEPEFDSNNLYME
ncbi:MAG: DUF1846 domain-containing protein [Clostridia bacterium]